MTPRANEAKLEEILAAPPTPPYSFCKDLIRWDLEGGGLQKM
jgi:hypothetical protein